MTTYLFGVLPEAPAHVRAEDEPPAGVRAVATAAGIAWVRAEAPVDAREVQRVLAVALGTGRTPVPARAGTHFADDDALRDALEGSAGAWRAALERVRDRVEMLVFVPLPDDADATPAATVAETTAEPRTGREYLEGLRRRPGGEGARHADAARRALRDAVGALAGEDAAVTHPSGRGTLVSHLVRRADVDAYRQAVDAWRAASGARHVVVLGPWPPFSFSEAAVATSERARGAA